MPAEAQWEGSTCRRALHTQKKNRVKLRLFIANNLISFHILWKYLSFFGVRSAICKQKFCKFLFLFSYLVKLIRISKTNKTLSVILSSCLCYCIIIQIIRHQDDKESVIRLKLYFYILINNNKFHWSDKGRVLIGAFLVDPRHHLLSKVVCY